MSSSSNQLFNKKLVVVTGAGRGIGRAIVLQLVKHGFSSLAIDVNQSNLEDTLGLVTERALVTPLVCDVSDWTRAADALKSTLTALTTDRVGASDVAGSEGAAGVAAGLVSRPLEVHALVNCAGFPVREPFGSINEASIDMQCNVMLKAAINLSQVVVPFMRRGSGSIVNISSVASAQGPPGLAVYSCLKAAIDHLTHCMAVELAPLGVRVNSVNPGLTNTEAIRDLPPAEHQEILRVWSVAPLGSHLVEPDEIANAVLFLIDNSNASLTGVNLRVDSGRPLV